MAGLGAAGAVALPGRRLADRHTHQSAAGRAHARGTAGRARRTSGTDARGRAARDRHPGIGLQPDVGRSRTPGARPRHRAGRHIPRPAHPACAPAPGAGDAGRRSGNARWPGLRHRRDGQDHRPVPGLRQRRVRDTVRTRNSTLAAEIAQRYARLGKVVTHAASGTQAGTLPLAAMAVRRAIANLVDNALRYAGEPVEIETRREPDRAVLEVRDRGPGIPPDQVERMKQPFTRLEAARSDAGGSGLGLAIVERVARLHGGSLELLPREGGGLVARLAFPLRTAPREA
ncbi:MAG: ATP-binding protein [Betaproteobacteria bacterium]|nr:ATP-binding protein [Betaproteobacteria bacterium]